MPLTGIWRFATPLLDVADAGGAGAPAAVDTPPVESDSLADHEATYSPDAQREPAADDDTRDDTGRFKPRHRAASQRADADDVPLISEHTRRIKDAEAKLGADIARKDGESERVYNLRRRAELLERIATPPTPEPAKAEPRAPAPPPRPQPRPAAAALAGDVPDLRRVGDGQGQRGQGLVCLPGRLGQVELRHAAAGGTRTGRA